MSQLPSEVRLCINIETTGSPPVAGPGSAGALSPWWGKPPPNGRSCTKPVEACFFLYLVDTEDGLGILKAAHRARLIRHKGCLTVTLSERKLPAGVLDIGFTLASLRTQVEQVNEQIEQLLETEQGLSEQYRLLRQVQVWRLMIAAHVLGFSRFRDWHNFACYISTAPFPRQLGTSMRGRTQASHVAHKRLMGLMTIGAANVLKRRIEYRKYYELKHKKK